MDMGDLSREELAAKLDALKSEMNARFAEQSAEMRVGFAQMSTLLAEHRADMIERCNQSEMKMQQNVVDLVKWIVGTGIAVVGIIVAVLALLANLLAVAAPVPGARADATAVKASPAEKVANRLLDRLQRHHQP